MKYIWEMPVYCGRLKEWRILNITTGSVYSGSHASQESASEAIEDGTIRAGAMVRRVSLREIQQLLSQTPA
jgi:hypothetical protein